MDLQGIILRDPGEILRAEAGDPRHRSKRRRRTHPRLEIRGNGPLVALYFLRYRRTDPRPRNRRRPAYLGALLCLQSPGGDRRFGRPAPAKIDGERPQTGRSSFGGPSDGKEHTIQIHCFALPLRVVASAGGLGLLSVAAFSAPALSASPVLAQISINIQLDPPPPPASGRKSSSRRTAPDPTISGWAGFWDGTPGRITSGGPVIGIARRTAAPVGLLRIGTRTRMVIITRPRVSGPTTKSRDDRRSDDRR